MGSVLIQLLNMSDTKEKNFSYDISGETSLFDLVSAWGREYSPDAPGRIFCEETGGIAATILVLKNGRSVKSDDPKTTMVSPGDAIVITPILLGG